MNTLSPALYLIPVTLGNTPIDQVLPAHNREVILGIRHFIVEEIRTARRFSSFLAPLRKGESVGVISEAGCPAVADPGADIVAIAQGEGLRVVPLVGPSSLLLAMMASGFNGQSFAFHGYLPIDSSLRAKRLKQLEARAREEHQTQLFIETPYRNARLFADILAACSPKTRLCVAAGLTTEQEYIRTQSLKVWRDSGLPDLGKIPAIFLIYA